MLAVPALLAIALFSFGKASDSFDFSRSFVVWVGPEDGGCTYFMTDVGESAKQLTATLRKNYDPAMGLEVLTGADTSRRCAEKAVDAAKKAGFTYVRVRPGRDSDRSPGIP